MTLTKKQIALGWAISTAHSWNQILPLKDKTLICRDCGQKTKIGEWDSPPCHEHIVGGNQ